MITGKERFLD